MIAKLHIQAALRGSKTFLKNSFCTTPFKVADITEDKSETSLKLMLMNSSPGILDEDEYEIEIKLDENSSLKLYTQSYQRLFSMKKSASQSVDVLMSKNSSFCFLPHPSVPHNASNFTAINTICLSQGCQLIWGEVLACGRKLCGEEFKFTRYQNLIKIFINGKLAVKENLLINPSLNNVKAIGQFENYTHQASLIFIDSSADINSLITGINEVLSRHKDISVGVSALPVNGIVVRLLGYKAEQLYNCLKMITDFFFTKEAHTISTNFIGEKEITYAS